MWVAEDRDIPLGMSLFRQLVKSIATQFRQPKSIFQWGAINHGSFHKFAIALNNWPEHGRAATRIATSLKTGSGYRRGFEQLDKVKQTL